jgi:hypothetical protein
MTSFRFAPPKAGPMVEALRGLGYSPATAVADLIDNSIAAGATKVAVTLVWTSGAAHLQLEDDGAGMTDAQLDSAMRLGDRDPRATRAPTDLGRFGLGLKTASFSQCRRLTVASKRDGTVSCLRWDLDLLANSDDNLWRLLEGPDPRSPRILPLLDRKTHGTLVVWEELDRMLPKGTSAQHALDVLDNIEQHLRMVFHRYLSGSHPKLRILLNDRALTPWDPFLTSHPTTMSLPEVTIRSAAGIVTAQGFVLPHKDRLDAATHEDAGGPDGWTAQQGFYVYRNERLLVAGGWLGLGRRRAWTREEAHRLARIRLDLPNTADTAWSIDIRKARAKPPHDMVDQLTALAEDVRAKARRVFAHRGAPRSPTAAPLQTAWQAEHSPSGTRYRVDEQHPSVKALLEDAGPLASQIRSTFRILAECLPVQRIWLDTTEAKETPRTGFSGEDPGLVRTIALALYQNLINRNGLSPEDARRQLGRTEPFHAFPDIIASLPDHRGDS